ncbi:MAG: alginate lyase family protein [Myxococcota bacterium]
MTRSVRNLAAAMARVPTVLRTVRPLRARQAIAQLHHALFGVGKPRACPGDGARQAIAHPATPYLPPAAHVRALGPGRYALLATPFDSPRGAAWTASEHGPLFAYHLHQHEYLRCEAVTPAERAAVIADWIQVHRAGVGWDPHPTGLRLIAWGKLMTTPGRLELGGAQEAALLRSFADQAETLSRNLEVRLQANHLLSNLLCVVFAGLLLDLPASAAWRGRADRLAEALADQIRPDGGHEERSPMYHALLLENVLDLLNLCRAAPDRAPAGLADALAEAAERMLTALAALAHDDGRIALFADSAFDVAAEPAALADYARRLGLQVDPDRPGTVCLPQSGYVRLAGGDWLLIASVAPPSPPHQPGHAHCDALAFELSVAGHRLVTDTGVFEYVVGPRREIARATASHATLQIDGEEQAEIWSAHRVGGRPEVALTGFSEAGEAEAVCRGWSRRATLHRRRFRVSAAGVEIEDFVEGPAREIVSRLPIAPEFAVELTSGAEPRALCRSRAHPPLSVEIALPAAFAWRLETGAYYPGFGRALERSVLVGVASQCTGARTHLRRIAPDEPLAR